MTPAELAGRIARLGLSQAEVARQIGVAQPNLNRWLRGHFAITEMRAAWLDRELSRLESTAPPTP